LGALGTGIDVARGVYGKNIGEVGKALGGETVRELPKGVVPLGERLGDNLMGTAAFAAMGLAAANGYVTGAGPEDREKKDMLAAQGWQPYSVKLGDKWVSYSNWGPVAVPLSLAAGLAESAQYRKPQDTDAQQYLDAFSRGAKMLTEQAYLQGVGAIYKGITQPDRYGESFVVGFLQSLVPYGSAINTAGQATDPYVRQPERGDLIGGLEMRLPGVRENQPPKQDQLGRPVANEMQGWAAVLPIRSSAQRPSPVLQALLDNGVDVPEPPKDTRNVPLSEPERRQFNEAAGRQIESLVGRIIADPKFASLPPQSRKTVLQNAVQNARNVASAEALRSIGGEQVRSRLEQQRQMATAGR
jgi:hypothetical protein